MAVVLSFLPTLKIIVLSKVLLMTSDVRYLLTCLVAVFIAFYFKQRLFKLLAVVTT